MAENSKSKANNLESDIKKRKKVSYTVNFGMFDEREKMNLPPENSKQYSGLLKAVEELKLMEVNAFTYTKILDKNGNVQARIGENGQVITGKAPKKKAAKETKKSVRDEI